MLAWLFSVLRGKLWVGLGSPGASAGWAKLVE